MIYSYWNTAIIPGKYSLFETWAGSFRCICLVKTGLNSIA